MTNKLPIINHPESTPFRQMTLPKKLFILGGGFLLLVSLIGIIVVFLVNRRDNGPANVDSAEKITKEFVNALHNKDIESAYGMLIEESRARQSLDEFTTHLETNANYYVFEKYQSLRACGFQFGDSGSITIMGLLHYDGGDVYFKSLMRQGSDKVLRIIEFNTISEKPEWGACQ